MVDHRRSRYPPFTLAIRTEGIKIEVIESGFLPLVSVATLG